jgi:alkanesulfonate monooxygenase SsuD/methylene tetrahydromethanopterin reductase-like flavin-dependent oxidoreductase (luciferase family)
MHFGMLHLFENPIGKSEHAIVHEQLALMRAAEDLGFDSVWPAEHHFAEYGYCGVWAGVWVA